MTGVLLENYSSPALRTAARDVASNLLIRHMKIPLRVAMDGYIVHYKPWPSVVFNPKARGAWKVFLEKYYETEEYKKLNSIVAGDPLLAKYATIAFLEKLYNVAQKKESYYEINKDKSKDSKGKDKDPISDFFTAVDSGTIPAQEVELALGEVKYAMSETLNELETARHFSHYGVPLARLLEEPEKLRAAAKNRIIVSILYFLRKLREEGASLKHARMPALHGGRPIGLKKMQRHEEVVDAYLPDTLDDDLFFYKLATRTLRVTERLAGLKNCVVYLDKSHSMTCNIKYYTSPTNYIFVPKISFAAASALALAEKLKRAGAKLTLKLFDTEVHDPITDFATLIDTLLKVRADGGTNITNALEDALANHKEEKIIVVTDGIDYVSAETVKKAKRADLDVVFVFIETDNELLRKNFRCVHLKEAKPSVLLEV